MKRILNLKPGIFSFRQLAKCFCSKSETVPLTRDVSLYKELKAKIKATGPITVANYMREVLTHPAVGYYMRKDVFGEGGDFITSPEISQLFGEMISIWFTNEWKQLNYPEPVQVIELGPGRGTLMSDMIRVFTRFRMVDFSIHLVEISDVLSKLQATNLCSGEPCDHNDKPYYRSGETEEGIQIFWYKSIYNVEIKDFPLLVAHEFFDALPIHKFQKTENGWREVLIDIDVKADSAGQEKFRYVLSREPTPTSMIFIPEYEKRTDIEISPESILMMQHLAKNFEKKGGIGLIIDYGHCGTKTDTFRAFRNHAQCDPLVEPGLADLTADVDFNVLKSASKDKLITFGPITQEKFLMRMGIEVRLQMLLECCTNEKEKESLLSGFKTLFDITQMGSSFHFFAFFPAILKEHLDKHPVYGFSDIGY